MLAQGNKEDNTGGITCYSVKQWALQVLIPFCLLALAGDTLQWYWASRVEVSLKEQTKSNLSVMLDYSRKGPNAAKKTTPPEFGSAYIYAWSAEGLAILSELDITKRDLIWNFCKDKWCILLVQLSLHYFESSVTATSSGLFYTSVFDTFEERSRKGNSGSGLCLCFHVFADQITLYWVIHGNNRIQRVLKEDKPYGRFSVSTGLHGSSHTRDKPQATIKL